MDDRSTEHAVLASYTRKQAHLRADSLQLSRQEMCRSHPVFERPEGMLDSPLADPHHLGRTIQTALHFFQYGLMLPTPDTRACYTTRPPLPNRLPATRCLQVFLHPRVKHEQCSSLTLGNS